MRKLIFCLLMLLLSNTVVFAASIKWEGNDHSYEFISSGIRWDEAKTGAESLGGYLVTITSASENSFLLSNFRTERESTFAWIGGYEPGDDGLWIWATGPETGMQFSVIKDSVPPYNYANWGGAEPNDYNPQEDYAMFNLGNHFAGIAPGQWADATPVSSGNDPVIGYLVEYNPKVVPEPASMLLFLLGGAGLVGRKQFKEKI